MSIKTRLDKLEQRIQSQWVPPFAVEEDVELSEDNRTMLYIPTRFAHGFLTLEDSTEVFYQMSEYYAKGQDRGFGEQAPLGAQPKKAGQPVL